MPGHVYVLQAPPSPHSAADLQIWTSLPMHLFLHWMALTTPAKVPQHESPSVQSAASSQEAGTPSQSCSATHSCVGPASFGVVQHTLPEHWVAPHEIWPGLDPPLDELEDDEELEDELEEEELDDDDDEDELDEELEDELDDEELDEDDDVPDEPEEPDDPEEPEDPDEPDELLVPASDAKPTRSSSLPQPPTAAPMPQPTNTTTPEIHATCLMR